MRRRWVYFVLLVTALLFIGCLRYQHDHISRVYHIFGLGWIMQGTNTTRIFGIGNVTAGSYEAQVSTGAVSQLGNPTNTASDR